MRYLAALLVLTLAPLGGCKKEKGSAEGWRCFAFDYQGKRRVHCEPSKVECEERKQSIADLGEDFTGCQATDEVFCFETGREETPRVCTPTMELCEYTRELHAGGLKREADEYGACYQLEEEDGAAVEDTSR